MDRPALTTISIREFKQATAYLKERLVPDRPGLYLWSLDTTRWLGQSPAETAVALDGALKAFPADRPAEINPYWHLSIGERRQAISPKKRELLESAFGEGNDQARWIARVTTAQQRPLYVGMTGNLRRRLLQHLDAGSALRKRLTKVDINVLDTVFTWTAAPVTTTGIPDEAVQSESSLDSEVTDDIPNATLRAAESLLIRLSMPIFNAKQD